MTAPITDLTKQEQSTSERFMLKVVNEFGTNVGEIALTKYQKRLAQNYFMAVDSVLKLAEEKRLKKKEEYRDPLPINWNTINMDGMARNVVSAARIGWDPLEKNHVSMIPFKNNTTKLYDITFIPGYRGLELKSYKYGLDVPDNIIVDLVYSNDQFKVVKKDRNNKIESFELNIVNPFDRGEIVGGFYYYEFHTKPEKNRLVTMSLKDIMKRKPKNASAEFWGGEKDIWKNNKRTGEKEVIDGWFEQMALKTVKRAAYGDITIDSQKIDDAYQTMLQNESTFREAKVEEDYNENANGEIIDVKPEATQEDIPSNDAEKQEKQESEQEDPDTSSTGGPDF